MYNNNIRVGGEIERALEDGVITIEEVQKILEAYSFDIQWNNSIIEDTLSEYGYRVRLNENYLKGLEEVSKPKKRFTRPEIGSRTRQRLVWLSIVAPAAMVSLYKLFLVGVVK
ncbi:hypothetical protein LCGC14_0506530 [marine sediment metagenome]|uniref:Uncharacterized protein n=1 Tax=marine sediment metagenome TaxID=412755 RepID=A0A0F9VAU8_9ZZZZ